MHDGDVVTLTFMVVVADVADYKAMCSGWAGLGVIYQGVTLQAVYPAHGTRGQPWSSADGESSGQTSATGGGDMEWVRNLGSLRSIHTIWLN